MKILITNDDGFGAEGLAALTEALSEMHDVRVLAPDRERSGVSHAVTLSSPSRVRRVGEGRYTCSGTPSDCVILARLGAIDFDPELVVSGINRGPNIGTDIVYSGTCGAARQAVVSGIPGIAVSCASFEEPLQYGAAAAFVAQHLEGLAALCGENVFININAPSSSETDLEWAWTFPSRRRYRDRLRYFDAPDGLRYCFLTGGSIDTEDDSGSDFHAVQMGLVSVSAVMVHPQTPENYPAGFSAELAGTGWIG